MKKVLVIAGTSDGKLIIENLLMSNIKVTATVSSKLGSDLLRNSKNLTLLEGNNTQQRFNKLISEINPCCVIDASHPFANDITHNAMTVCTKNNIPYLRFERERVEIEGEDIIRVNNYEGALNQLISFRGNILLTIGIGKLDIFTRIPQYKERLYVRVLPEKKVIEKCENLGLNARNIIAMKGPFSEDLNIEFIKYCNADILVMKESGNRGGILEKVNAARKMDIPVLIIERADLKCDYKADSINQVMSFIDLNVINR